MLNELENEKLIADCQRCNLSYGEYFRRLLMNENIKEKPGKEFYVIMKQLSKIGVNLNQIAYRANKNSDINEEYYKELANEWQEFSRQVKSKFL